MTIRNVTRDEATRLLHAGERLARLSDRLARFGPFNLGLDSLLALVPGVGGLYTIGVGVAIVGLGWRAGASGATLARMTAYVAVDAVTAETPILGPLVDTLFPGHVLAARALRRDLEARHGPLPSAFPGRARRFGFGLGPRPAGA